jgi:hypothetical protein
LTLRYLFDPTGDFEVDDALAADAARTNRETIRSFLDAAVAGRSWL